MDEIRSALDFLLGGVILPFIIIGLLLIFAVFNVREHNYYLASGLNAALIFCVGYAYAPLGSYMIANPLQVVLWIIGHIIIGLGVSVGKWAYVVRDSKARLVQIRKDFEVYKDNKSETEYLTIESYIRDRSTVFTVKTIEGEECIVVNTDNQPIAEWIMFWPFTLLTYVFEPLWSVVSTAAKRMGRLYDTISVKMLKM